MMVHDVDSMNIRLTIEYLLLVLLDAVADLRGGAPPMLVSPYDPKFSQFHVVFRKIWQNHMLAPPPAGNPGSAPAATFVTRKHKL